MIKAIHKCECGVVVSHKNFETMMERDEYGTLCIVCPIINENEKYICGKCGKEMKLEIK